MPMWLQAADVTAALRLNFSSALLAGRQSVTTTCPSSIWQNRSGRCRTVLFLLSGHVSSNGCPEMATTGASRSASMT